MSRLCLYGPVLVILAIGAVHPAILSMTWFVVFIASLFKIGNICLDAQEAGESAVIPIAAWLSVVVGCGLAVFIAAQL